MASPAIIAALKAAGRRGVVVTVTMTANPAWTTAWRGLTRSGVQVATYPATPTALYIHAKAMVADGTMAFVGSQNFSLDGLAHNRELGIITGDASVVGPLAQTMAADFAGGTRFGAGPGGKRPHHDGPLGSRHVNRRLQHLEDGVGGTDGQAPARLNLEGGHHAVLDDHGVALGPGAEAEAAAVHLEPHGRGERTVAVGQQGDPVAHLLVLAPGLHDEGVVHRDAGHRVHALGPRSSLRIR